MEKALGHKARYRKAEGVGTEFQLKENQVPCSPGFDTIVVVISDEFARHNHQVCSRKAVSR